MIPLANALVDVGDGISKTRLLREYALRGSLNPMIRDIAVELVRSARRDDHPERLARLHRFVRDSVPYHREPVEMFHHPVVTVQNGGDCDDHASLLCALAWSLRYPWLLEAVGKEDDPDHYTTQLGWPPNDAMSGDAQTRWRSYETTVDALPGEHAQRAARRLGL